MTNAVIVSTARTPLAKSWRGAFNMTHGATLGGHAVKHAIARAGIDAGSASDSQCAGLRQRAAVAGGCKSAAYRTLPQVERACG